MMILLTGKFYLKLFFSITIGLFVFHLLTSNHPSYIQTTAFKQNHSKPDPRIYCFILTTPKYFDTRTRAVNSTWAPRCDRYAFISEYSNDTKGLPIAPIPNITSGYGHLTQKSTLAFHYVYENFANDYDWVIKADDDTYLFVENLKTFLKEQNTSEPVTFGYNFKTIVSKGYHSGGGGYVLSREAVKRFYEAHRRPNTTCVKDGGSEDVEIAKCLRTVGVYPGKSIDEQNRERFHVLSFSNHFLGPFPDWLYQYADNKLLSGAECCSNTTISFHYVSTGDIYLIDKIRYGLDHKT